MTPYGQNMTRAEALKSNPQPLVPDPQAGGYRPILAALPLAVSAVFGPTLGHEFVNIDDTLFIQQNPLVVHGLTWQSVAQAFREPHAANWIPLTWVSHVIDWEVFGNHAGATT